MVSAIRDERGNYIAPMVTWSIVTQKIKADAENERLVGILRAIGKAQATIDFEMDRTILTANENLLAAMGYNLAEIEGKHHSLFVEPSYKDSSEYRLFWDNLRSGKFQVGLFKRIGKGGNEVWIQASYNPLLDASGKPAKVVKLAVDVTEQTLQQIKADAQAAQLTQMVKGIPIGVMMCDVEKFEINYKFNTDTLKTLEQHLPVRVET